MSFAENTGRRDEAPPLRVWYPAGATPAMVVAALETALAQRRLTDEEYRRSEEAEKRKKKKNRR